MHSDIAFSNKIEVIGLLEHLEDYVVIKKDKDFPDYHEGADVDLVVIDRDVGLKKILHYFDVLGIKDIDIKVANSKTHCHIDFMSNGRLDLRIDLIDNFDFFERFSVRSSFIIKLFKDRKKVSMDGKNIYFPSGEDDLTLRYFEYLEYFDSRPDKIKHIEFIENVEDEALKTKFFQNSHEYIHFKPKKWSAGRDQFSGDISSGRQALRLLRISFFYVFYFVSKRVFRFFSKLVGRD